MRRILKVAMACLLATIMLAAPAAAGPPWTEPGAGSSLSGWALDGGVIVPGTQDSVSAAMAYRCSAVFSEIDEYNDHDVNADPELEGLGPYDDGTWPDYLTKYDLYDIEVDALQLYGVHTTPHGLNSTEINFCGDVHTNGWLPATADLVDWIENDDGTGILQVTVDGEMTCDDNQILMVSSTYYYSYWDGAWTSYQGTDWTESFSGGLTVSGNYAFDCLTIFDDYDPANFVNNIIPAQVNLSPVAQGLTGLETWLWYEFPTAATYRIDNEAVVINRYGRDWVLEAHAWVDAVHWDIDCVAACTYRGSLVGFDLSGYEYDVDFADTALSPAPSYEAGAGTEGDAAAEHLYETKGAFQVSTATVWRGYWTFEDQIHLYAPVVVAEGRAYDVFEIIPVLTGDDE